MFRKSVIVGILVCAVIGIAACTSRYSGANESYGPYGVVVMNLRDGSLQRIEDKPNGVVCYAGVGAAIRYGWTSSITAISCVKVTP